MSFKVGILVWPGCVTLGKPIDVSEPLMAHLDTVDLNTSYLLGYCEVEMRCYMQSS